LNVKAKGQRSRPPGTKTHYALQSHPAATEWKALAANNVMQQQAEPFPRYRMGDFGGMRAIYVS